MPALNGDAGKKAVRSRKVLLQQKQKREKEGWRRRSLEKEKRGNGKKSGRREGGARGSEEGGRMGEQRGLMIFSRLGPKSPTRVGRPDRGVLSKWMDTSMAALAVARCAMLSSPEGCSLSKLPML